MRSYQFIFVCLCLVGTSLSSSARHHHHHHLKDIMRTRGHPRAHASSASVRDNVPAAQPESDVMDDQTLAQMLDELEEDLRTDNVKPAAYLTGGYNIDWVTYNEGDVITHWSTNTSGDYPSVLQGGMTYSDGYITVPETGLYFIYFTLFTRTSSVNVSDHPSLYVDWLQIGFSEEYFENTSGKSKYLGKLWKVDEGSRLSVEVGSTMQYLFLGDYASFGAWKVD